jgi:uncharacterized membrane protein
MRISIISGVFFPLFTILLLSRGFFVSDAYAYLDPGTGSVIIQAVIGAIAAVLITLKIYWYKLKEKLSR